MLLIRKLRCIFINSNYWVIGFMFFTEVIISKTTVLVMHLLASITFWLSLGLVVMLALFGLQNVKVRFYLGYTSDQFVNCWCTCYSTRSLVCLMAFTWRATALDLLQIRLAMRTMSGNWTGCIFTRMYSVRFGEISVINCLFFSFLKHCNSFKKNWVLEL